MGSVLPASRIDSADTCEGALRANALLQIDGTFKGKIASIDDIIISSGAIVESAIIARSVVIAGSFKGTLQASKRVVLLSGSAVEGEIISPQCEVETGSLVNADMTISPHSSVSQSPSQRDTA